MIILKIANTEIVAPPSTHDGIVRRMYAIFGMIPATSMIIAAIPNSLFATTFVELTIPTF